ncbi:MAG TPA: hypothetical protein ENH62_10090 [Marinobacter sp.]|uniref:Uncharacterized protein n=1 Tax=marine sediment metagenome TaxID=412755 RepID=A0A0F9PZT2_9ZZZZ|nr:hypothetical protein [Marinobacter sp.]
MSERDTGPIRRFRLGPRFEFINTVAITAATTLEVTALEVGYDYIFQLENFKNTGDDETLWMRFSDDGGATYEAGASDYAWGLTANGTQSEDDADAQIDLTVLLGNDTGNRNTVEITLVNPNSAGETTAHWVGFFMNAAATPLIRSMNGGALFEQGPGVVDAVQFLWSGGSVFTAIGSITVWRRNRV